MQNFATCGRAIWEGFGGILIGTLVEPPKIQLIFPALTRCICIVVLKCSDLQNGKPAHGVWQHTKTKSMNKLHQFTLFLSTLENVFWC